MREHSPLSRGKLHRMRGKNKTVVPIGELGREGTERDRGTTRVRL